MADFPRTVRPRYVSPFVVPGGMVSPGQSGKAQLRGIAAAGRRWTETWGPIKAGKLEVEALLAFIELAWATSQIFDIEHYLTPGSGKTPNGTGGGTPLIAGASQSGASLVTDGWTPSITNIVRAGDVIRITGLPALYRITADASSTAGGVVTLAIDPPILAGSSPADNAPITRSGCKLAAYIAAPPQVPQVPPNQYIAGLTLTFAEAL